MRTLPPNVNAYGKTPVFTQETAPAGLLKGHATKDGVWGLIHVLCGELRLTIEGTEAVHVLRPGAPGTIEPAQPHHVTPLGDVEFYVEFHR